MMTKAVAESNLDTLTNSGVPPETIRNWRDSNGRTLLHFACLSMNPLSLSGLYTQFAFNPHALTKQGDSPAHICAYHNGIPCLELLTLWGVDLQGQNLMGESPAHKAALRGNLEVLAYLHDAGADITRCLTNQGLTPLDLASESGTYETVEFLKRAGGVLPPELDEGGAMRVGDMHVPEFYRLGGSWERHLPPGPGTPSSRQTRRREASRGRGDNGNGGALFAQDGIQSLFGGSGGVPKESNNNAEVETADQAKAKSGKLLYLTSRNDATSERALNKVREAHESWKEPQHPEDDEGGAGGGASVVSGASKSSKGSSKRKGKGRRVRK